MGWYINGIGVSYEEKVSTLKNKHNAAITDNSFKDDLVCVVDNGMFAAAAYMKTEQEFQHFNEPDTRRKIWLIVPNAAELID